MEFSDKVVFVTAAAGAGIGQAVARTFASEGATVVLSDQHPGRTETVAAQIAAETGDDVSGVALDVRDEAGIDEVINGVVAQARAARRRRQQQRHQHAGPAGRDADRDLAHVLDVS